MVPLAITSAVLLAVGITGLLLRHNLFQKHEMEVLRADLSQTQNYALQLKAKLNQAAQAESRTATDTQRLERQLADAGARAARLEAEHEQDVKAIRSLQDQVAGLTSENAGVARRASASDEELASLRGQLQQLRAAAADKENQLSVVQFQIAELSSRLKAQESALERERQLLAAGRDIRDLMGARNLHIIDVHDMDARGESRPFGRIFLTEGKRLIFYAYDLDSVKIKNASFQAWGQRSDDTRAAVSLGILYMDDQKQSRWALKVEDPDLLKALDSVFVTVEPRGGTERPTGKKLMYAFLRNPINHP
jgi:predicted RNase H-like nuclease (RuvC/YqgF family)